MYLRTNPETNQLELHSSFSPRQIQLDRYLVTALSTMGHGNCPALLFLEHIGRGNLPETRLIHLVGDGAGVGSITCQTSRPSGIGEFEFIERRQLPNGSLPDELRIRCYEANNLQRDALLRSVEKLRVKKTGNRYLYQQAGGIFGWIGASLGPGGSDSREFLARLLKDSGIDQARPPQSAGGSRRYATQSAA